MKLLKYSFSYILFLSIISCQKSNYCECSTYDNNGEFQLLITRGEVEGLECDSKEIVITDNGDTNTIVCETVRRY